jgi:hypothetical protein
MSAWRRSWAVLLALGCAVLGWSALSATSALAFQGKGPVIESMSAGIGGEVTVGAKINPEGLETTYAIALECPSCEPSDQRVEGRLPAGQEGVEVSLTLTGLKPGTYWFGVLANNAAGEAFRRSDILEVPAVPPGACPDGCPVTEPYTPPELPWANESGNIAAERTVREYNEEQQAKAAAAAKEAAAAREAAVVKELEAAKARQAAMLASEAAALEYLEEETLRSAEAEMCTVPSLRGDTLLLARKALAKAHCRLGRISQLSHHSAKLVVIRQAFQHGKRLPHAAAVSVTLAAAPRRSS